MDLKAITRRATALLLTTMLCGVTGAQTPAQARFIVMASTTSTEQSGLFAHLLPACKAATGLDVRVVAVGTGQALDMARRGDADVVLVHDTAAEEMFVAEGYSAQRRQVMFNDFVLIGPSADPAKARGSAIAPAFKAVAAAGAAFVSRGDKSGTHAAEQRLWKAAGIDITSSKPAGLRDCGCGMGAALNMAASMNAYTLSDRGSWLAFKNRAALAIVVEGDKSLANQYGVMVVNAAKHPHVKQDLARAFADWVVAPAGQAVIAAYKINGEQLFFANARK